MVVSGQELEHLGLSVCDNLDAVSQQTNYIHCDI